MVIGRGQVKLDELAHQPHDSFIQGGQVEKV
jgi:hypothetical protein